MISVAIRVPTVSTKAEGQVHPMLSKRIVEACQNSHFSVDFDYIDNVSPIARARDLTVSRVLSLGHDWLVMCDLDTVPPPNFMELMLIGSPAEASVIVAPYATFSTDGIFSLSVGNKVGKRNSGTNVYAFPYAFQQDGWQSFNVGGFGCVAMRTKMLAKLQVPYFPMPKLDGQTEDIAFLEKHGLQVFTHPSLFSSHFRIVDISLALRVQNLFQSKLDNGKVQGSEHKTDIS